MHFQLKVYILLVSYTQHVKVFTLPFTNTRCKRIITGHAKTLGYTRLCFNSGIIVPQYIPFERLFLFFQTLIPIDYPFISALASIEAQARSSSKMTDRYEDSTRCFFRHRQPPSAKTPSQSSIVGR